MKATTYASIYTLVPSSGLHHTSILFSLLSFQYFTGNGDWRRAVDSVIM